MMILGKTISCKGKSACAAACVALTVQASALAQESLTTAAAVTGVSRSSTATPRLSEITDGIGPDQQSPFSTIIDARFQDAKIVGEAFSQLASYAGYEVMVSGSAIDPMAKVFFASPLADVHRTFRHTSVRDALVALAGEGYTVVVDHAERTISVDVRPSRRIISRLEEEVRR